jgi:DNA adenine methylase
MCAYFGGKSRNGKDIALFIKKRMEGIKCDELIEPFCGILGVTRHLVDDYLVTSSDYNEDLIFLLEYLQKNPTFTMPVINREKFDELKKAHELSFEKSFAMLFCTYMSHYKGSYLPNDCADKTGRLHPHHTRNFNNLNKNIIPVINKFKFYNWEYDRWDEHLSSGGYVVYCDPPYVNTSQAYKKNNFDSDKFWKIMKKWKDYGNYIFVSELTCPIKHEELYSKSSNISASNKKKRMIDKLFFIL